MFFYYFLKYWKNTDNSLTTQILWWIALFFLFSKIVFVIIFLLSTFNNQRSKIQQYNWFQYVFFLTFETSLPIHLVQLIYLAPFKFTTILQNKAYENKNISTSFFFPFLSRLSFFPRFRSNVKLIVAVDFERYTPRWCVCSHPARRAVPLLLLLSVRASSCLSAMARAA